MRPTARFQPRPIPEDHTLMVAVLEEIFDDLQAVLNDLGKAMTAAPATASSPGLPGQVAYDSDFFYVCVGPDEWKRTALSTW